MITMEDNPQPPNTWEFTAALELLASWKPHTSLPLSRASGRPKTPPLPSPFNQAHLYDPKISKPSGLGDLDRLYNFLGITYESSSYSTHDSANSQSSSASEKSTPPSSLPGATEFQEIISKSKEVRWRDEAKGSSIVEYGRRSSRSSTLGLETLQKSIGGDTDFENSVPSRNTRSRRKARARLAALADTSEFESEPEYLPADHQHSRHSVCDRGDSDEEDTVLATIDTTLIPSAVTPVRRSKAAHSLQGPPPVSIGPFNPPTIPPLEFLTREEKYANLVKKLQKRYSKEKTALIRMKSDHVAKKFGGKFSTDGIHIFVDCSNIVIGFIDQLKRARNMDVRSPAKGGKLSWHTLALILERGRPAARRILVGSHGTPLDSKQHKRPEYLTEAEACGYELNILERVVKTKDATPRKKRRGHGNGYATASGYSSGSDGTYLTRKAVTEQGVDEILHMKLLESLVDTAVPSTIVLASGDAAEAEYSGGFMKNVERALKTGWKVELAAWSAGLSRDYQSDAFLKRWKSQFSITLLDDFSEEMFAVYADNQGSFRL